LAALPNYDFHGSFKGAPMLYQSAEPERPELFRDPSAVSSAQFTPRIGATPRQIRHSSNWGASGVMITASAG
jgi:hypothetical protein